MRKGSHHTIEHNKQVSEKMKLVRLKNNPFKGKHHTKEHNGMISIKLKGINAGEKNGNWRGGSSKNQYRGDDWDVIRKIIYKRDSYTCQLCGKIKCKIEVHHIIPWRITQNNNFNNLISLCKSCHKKEDNKIIREEKEMDKKSN